MRLSYINSGDSEPHSDIPVKQDAGQYTDSVSLKKTASLLTDMLELAKLGTWEFNIDNGLVSGCPLFKKIFGLHDLQIIDYNQILRKIPREQRPEFRQAIAETTAGNILNTEIAIGKQKEIWLKITGKLFCNGDGSTKKMAGIVEDITESRNKENVKNNMISYLSHEIRSPLTTLKLYIQRSVLLAGENGQEVIATFLRKADDQVTSMNKLTDTYLDQAAIENGGFKLNISRFDITRLISEIASDIQFQSPGYQFDIKMPPELLLQADRVKIGQAIANLLKNAVKYSSTNSKITIQCIPQSDFALIIVKDQGIGIEKKDLKNLFNRFYRVKSPATSGISGYGIGLHLVRNIINAHNGQIAVTSNPNYGSEFLFTLPVINAKNSIVHQ
ncbi:PAS domain-containing sensor histidine kinase [Mucilaginibacter psychrotolerans]|uniref:histidine kinase n=1 Tax=Mucilaginibacter psychrotolerans TaxID=1524096 RepID=A0A4Y8SGQ5_9SPHI|nr:HAMP domain-containing sensor histidine kinase [Mucilaginibacter psychrotolerans]TFF37800.1 HAMP domain-containing histidine kinase [Mucilaginibacter psychrotolerans]